MPVGGLTRERKDTFVSVADIERLLAINLAGNALRQRVARGGGGGGGGRA